LLRDWKTIATGEFVFPGKNGRPLTDVKRTWETVRRGADLPGVRLHDLRHTQASFLASNGESLHAIGKILGHTQPRTTARYAHLVDDALRRAVNRAAASMGEKDITPDDRKGFPSVS
jgi:integrase